MTITIKIQLKYVIIVIALEWLEFSLILCRCGWGRA